MREKVIKGFCDRLFKQRLSAFVSVLSRWQGGLLVEASKIETILTLRGYKIVDLKETPKDSVFVVDVEKDGVGQRIVVKIVPSTRVVGTAIVRELKENMNSFNADKGLLMGGKRSTPNAEALAEESGIELLVDYPHFNIFDHELVPKHEIVGEEERRWLLETFHVKEYQLPKIKDTDPAVKAIGAKPGDIVKITRKSLTAGEVIFYRYVIKGKYTPQMVKEEPILLEREEEEGEELEWEEEEI